jgi:hypothetical protein
LAALDPPARDVARRPGVSVRSVGTHVGAVRVELRVEARVPLARWPALHGWDDAARPMP